MPILPLLFVLAWRQVLSTQFDWLQENGKIHERKKKKQILKSDEMEILTIFGWRAKDPNVHAMNT